jgi:hypothetical protein
MWSRRPTLVCISAFLTLAAVVTATATGLTAVGLYELTDEELSGPPQPIQFSHKVHATLLAMDCKYCHTGVDKGQHAVIPALSTCYGCHQWVKVGTSEGSAEEIAKIAEQYANGDSVLWVRIHNLPEHVQFKHNRHVWAEIQCAECHGPVEEMNRVWLVPDTRFNSSSAWLPAAKLEMGWCVDCHEKKGGSKDCVACHY